MIGYLNKWVSSKQITKLIMPWTNGTKEAIRLGGVEKIRSNHQKHSIDLLLLMASTRLDYINSMCNNDFNNNIYLEIKKVYYVITSLNAKHNKVSGKENLFNALV